MTAAAAAATAGTITFEMRRLTLRVAPAARGKFRVAVTIPESRAASTTDGPREVSALVDRRKLRRLRRVGLWWPVLK